MRILGVTASSILKVTSSYESIASATGTGSSGTITFSSIPATYKHLQVRTNVRNLSGAASARAMYARFNSDTGNNYTLHRLYGDGSSATASGSVTGDTGGQFFVDFAEADNGSAANIHGVAIIDIIDYANTSKYKTVRMFSGTDLNSSGRIYLSSALWVSTSAINSITFEDPTANGFTTSSTFALYGIKG